MPESLVGSASRHEGNHDNHVGDNHRHGHTEFFLFKYLIPTVFTRGRAETGVKSFYQFCK